MSFNSLNLVERYFIFKLYKCICLVYVTLSIMRWTQFHRHPMKSCLPKCPPGCVPQKGSVHQVAFWGSGMTHSNPRCWSGDRKLIPVDELEEPACSNRPTPKKNITKAKTGSRREPSPRLQLHFHFFNLRMLLLSRASVRTKSFDSALVFLSTRVVFAGVPVLGCTLNSHPTKPAGLCLRPNYSEARGSATRGLLSEASHLSASKACALLSGLVLTVYFVNCKHLGRFFSRRRGAKGSKGLVFCLVSRRLPGTHGTGKLATTKYLGRPRHRFQITKPVSASAVLNAAFLSR